MHAWFARQPVYASSIPATYSVIAQAPVPYLNRALAEEQMGVDADEQNQHQEAQEQYTGAVQVASTAPVLMHHLILCTHPASFSKQLRSFTKHVQGVTLSLGAQ